MPRRIPLSTLRTRCQRRSDKENDAHISDAEWAELISEAYAEMYEIVAGAGLRYFETSYTFTATGAAYYDEPEDHGKTIGFDRVDSDGSITSLRPLMAQERSRYGGVSGDAYEYAIVDASIYLYPNPSSGTYQLLYIPQPPDITTYADGDMIDLVCAYGEAFVVWGTAVKAISKGEGDVRLAMTERDRCGQRLLEWAAERDATEPRRRVIDEENPW